MQHDSLVMAGAKFMTKELAQWGVLYAKGGAVTQLALSHVREHQPSISAAFALLSLTPVSLEAVDAACDASDLCTDGLAMFADVSYEATWRVLAAGGTGLSDTSQHAKAQRSLGWLLFRRGQYEEAAAFLRSAWVRGFPEVRLLPFLKAQGGSD